MGSLWIRKGRTAAAAIAMVAAGGLFISATVPTLAHDGNAYAMEMEESGIVVSVDGKTLPSKAIQSSDLAELRVNAREVANELGLPVKWDAARRAMLIGTAGSAGGMDAMPTIVYNGQELSGADPMIMNGSMTAVADELAKGLGLRYQFDAAHHAIRFVSERETQQFESEEQQVRDVLNGIGLTPTILPDGTKEFTLTAELHDWSPVEGVRTTAWTFNGQAPGPTIRVTEGDHVRIRFWNNLPEPSTVHWHGLLIPNAMDGVPGITQEPVQQGGSFVYEFTASHAGTFIYHSHYDDATQIGGGMYGAFIIDPKEKPAVRAASQDGDLSADMVYDHDYTMLLGGFRVNTTGEEEEDYFTINGRSYPDTPPIELRQGETARIRLINMDTMEPHTMHLHGMDFTEIARNGSPLRVPETMNTVLLGPGETVDIAFRADNPGDWMFQCHILDHTMNGGDMSKGEMGGLVTIVKVSE